QRRAAVVRDTLERIRAIPQVKSASSIDSLPTRPSAGTGYNRADRPAPASGAGKGGGVGGGSDDYFRTLGIPLVTGREFDRRDRIGSPGVAIVNREAAKLLFDAEDPIGKRLKVAWSGATDVEIIGLAENIRHDGFAIEPQPTLFLCTTQTPSLFAT